ncbi:hypothetical protein, conserved [Babesia bigemina]|uniref:Uncharacterized protein n=1 Tax=Babesia bigemina TaxID=5866 RepID=A0A061D8C8_BABBI|nr:hypothetical protein, conserved [Babesia bigemina]CDR93990.1 hypothetical protein, conserved [Babesia bigemina]|eukprot:XP_012766176.1 hypothetical protein, conserved [Babesia bigemina]
MEDLHVESARDISKPLDDTLLAAPGMHCGVIGEESTLHLSDIKGAECIGGNPAPIKATEAELMSLASIETQPPPIYNQFGSVYANADFSYDPDKQYSGIGAYYNGCYGMEGPWPCNVNQSLDGIESLQSQLSLDSQSSVYSAPGKGATKLEPEAQPIGTTLMDMQNQESYLQQQQPCLTHGLPNKVVAMNPVILVDKVERSLIVQWYENGVKREQRISYKKYGNAKAQQRAESLITKLMSGSTFDQLYPEKGPPILTIFENVGRYNVTLTRDRILREWRVEWTNNTGGNMRARWSCKKVGNEEAKRRAETFANSLIQGTFNPRLLHKATGTRLSRNDMKYSAVVNDPGYDPNNLPYGLNVGQRRHRKETAPRRKRNMANAEPGRKKGTRTVTRKRQMQGDLNAPPNGLPLDVANTRLDVSYPGFYPVVADPNEQDCALNHSFDGMGSQGEALAAQNWLNWSAAGQKPPYAGGSEWDFGELQNDINGYGKLYDIPQTNSMPYGEWMNTNGMAKFGSPTLDAPMTMCELAEDAPADSQNANAPFFACYPYFPTNQSICYSDPMSSQDQLGGSGTFFDTDFLSESQNTNPAMNYASMQWIDPDMPNADPGSAHLMMSTNSNSDGGMPLLSAQMKGKKSRKGKKSSDESAVSSYDCGADVTGVGMATAWQAYNGFPMTAINMNGSGSPSDFKPMDMYNGEGGCIRIGMGDASKKDKDMSKEAAGAPEMPGFYAVPNMVANGGMQSTHAMGNMGNLYY